MIKFTFKNIEEFVSYLDNNAKEARNKCAQLSPRSHAYAEQQGVAYTHERIANIVRASNLEVPGGLFRG